MLITVTVLAVFAALVSALAVGYYCGRRASSTPSTWKRRTSRTALGKRAVGLLVLVAVRRARRRLRTGPMPEMLTLRMLALSGLSRSTGSRRRPYRVVTSR